MRYHHTILVLALAGLSASAWGGGFAISGKSASNLGNAFSGTGVLAEDASVVYTNPAAMQELQGQHFSVLVHSIGSDLQFTDEGSNVSGPARTRVDDPHYVPNLYAVSPLAEDVRFGIGIYSPFGLGLDYDDDWQGRYITTNSHMRIVNVSPALSFDVDDRLNLGFGIDFQYLEATLENAVDFPTICGAYLAAGYLGSCTASGDGSQTLNGSNWTVGYSLGLTYDLSRATRLGMSFHSATRHDITGTSEFKDQPAELLALDMFDDTTARLTLMLPETLDLGLSHRLSPRLQLLADATWTRWSRYDELYVDFANNTPSSRSEENWQDTWRLSVGGNYRLTEAWLLRGGFSHDPTPVPDAQHRSPRVPCATRNWLALGSNVVLEKGMDLDLALSYTLPVSYRIDNTDSLGHTLEGEYESEILYLTAQLNWAF